MVHRWRGHQALDDGYSHLSKKRSLAFYLMNWQFFPFGCGSSLPCKKKQARSPMATVANDDLFLNGFDTSLTHGFLL